MAIASYAAPFSVRFQRLLTYRAAAFAGFVARCWWCSLKLMIFDAFYTSAPNASPALSLAQTISYIWLAQALFSLLPFCADPEVTAAVRDGSVAYDRLRPVDTYTYWFARAAAWLLGRTAPQLVLVLPLSVVVLPAIGLGAWALAPPVSLVAFATMLLSLALGVSVAAATMTLASAFVVRSGDDRGVNALMLTLAFVLTGSELPLLLFPDWARTFLLLQPFAGVFDTPLRIYCGALQGHAIVYALALQVFWVFALVVLGRRLLASALLHLEVQGG